MTQDQGTGDAIEFNGASAASNYKDEPKFRKLDKPAQWRIMAENGDVHALLQEAPPPSRILMDPLCNCLHDAIEKLARDNPAAFARFLQTEMLASAGMMVMRAQYLLNKQLRREHSELEIWSDQTATDKLAATVAQLNIEAAKLMNLSASSQLTIERVRKLRLANDKAEAKKNRQRQPRRRRISPPRPQPLTGNSRMGGDLP